MARRTKGRSQHRRAAGSVGAGPRVHVAEHGRATLAREIARLWTTFVGGISTALLSWMVAMLIGMQPVPGTVPIFNLVSVHPALVSAAAVVVFVITATAWLVARMPPAAETRQSDRRGAGTESGLLASRRLLAASTLSATFSTVALAAVLGVVLLQPAWCPRALCLQPTAPHDQYLETDLTTIESGTYLIPLDPSRYGPANLPANAGPSAIAAHRIGADADQEPYRVVIRVHSLQRGGFGMFIEWVRLPIRRVQPVPQPLRVWQVGAPLDYGANPYRAAYSGERTGEYLAALHEGPVPDAHVQLAPGESDELAITLDSHLAADLTFRVEIGYRVSSEQQVHTFVLPYDLRAVFSDALNWQTYQLQGQRFVPA